MASRRPPLRTTVLVLAGAAGVVLAHGLDYLLVIRASAQRATTLAATGHGWWPSALGAGVAAAVLAVSLATSRGATGAVFRRAADAGARSAWRDVGCMSVWQAAVFAAVEVTERLGAHRSPIELLHGPLFPVGLLLQVVVAAGVVGLLRLVERAGATVADGVLTGRRRPHGARRPRFVPVAPAVVGGRFVAGRHEARGPPLSVAA